MAARKTKTEKIKSQIKPEKGLNADIFNADGEKIGNKALLPKYFGQKTNSKLVLQAIRVYMVNNRSGNVNTKTRGEVSGGGRKPWKEKGTGRARQGSIRAPHWRGGGIVFGPKIRNFDLKLSDELTKKAIYISLSDKAKDQKIKILKINEKDLDKTKKADQLLKKLYENINKNRLLMVYSGENALPIKFFRNLNYLTLVNIDSLNTLYIVKHNEILFLEEAFKKYDK
jgi:large subunit ribosomal protein L4